MNTKLHAITDTKGRPIRLFITAGQVNDYTGAAALMNGLPEAEWLLADRVYDADWFRETFVDKGTAPCKAMLDKNHDYCPDIVKLTNGGVGLLRPRKLFEEWLADNYDQSERMTFVKKAKVVLTLASRDGEVKARLTSDRKSVKCLLLKE
jgi:IS5 family transposase